MRSPVAADVHVDVEERPPASVGAGACFVVGEALANIAKHSKATSADVTVRRNGERLIVKERDDAW
jgi:signal transduction histidine kinase